MKAWRIHGFGDMRLDEVPDPIVAPGQALIQIRVVQPSVTEVIRFNGNTARRSKEFEALIHAGPVQLFGHEASGTVIKVAEDVSSLRAGDRVAIFSGKQYCHSCRFCVAGYAKACLNPLRIGQEIKGCFAEYAALPAECLVKLADDVTFRDGAVIQSLTSAFRSVLDADIRPGDVVAVFGQGAMGLAATQLAKVLGARLVFTTARRQSSRDISAELGADVVIDVTQEDPVESLLRLTGGIGVDVAVEAAGGSTAEGLAGYDTFFQAVDAVRPGGTVVVASSLVEPVTIPTFQRFQGKGMRVVFSTGFRRDMRAFVVEMIASERIRIAPMVTHSLDGLESVPRAFEITGNKRAFDAINPCQVVVSSE